MKELICIVCPRGCHLKVDADLNVTGNACPRGAAYAKKEVTAPERTLTTTVRLESASLRRLPVRTDRNIPKGKLFDAMGVAETLCVKAPVRRGQVLVENIVGTDANLIATRDVEA